MRHHLRTINLPESIALGRQLLAQALSTVNIDPDLPEPLAERLLNESSAKSMDELYADIGIGKRMAALVARHIFGLLGGESAAAPVDHNSAAELDPVTICGSEGVSVQLAQCCLPIPGDSIIGQLRRDQGLQVHTLDCSIAKRQRQKEPERWIAVKWGTDINRRFDSRIKLLINNEKGILARGKLAPAWRFDIRERAQYPRRSLVIQYQESDFAFAERLMSEEGLFYYYEHSADAGSPGLGVHTLVIADHNGSFQPNPCGEVRFTQPGAVMKQDSMDRWRTEFRLGTNTVELLSWDYRALDERSVSAASADPAGDG
eukprot:gene33182-37490_t